LPFWQQIAWGASLIIMAAVSPLNLLARVGNEWGTQMSEMTMETNRVNDRPIDLVRAGRSSALRHQGARAWPRDMEPQTIVEPKLSVRKPRLLYGSYRGSKATTWTCRQQGDRDHRAVGCGKSTHIPRLQRIYELYREQRSTGEVILDGENILAPRYDLIKLRKKVGMIFSETHAVPDDRVRQRRLRLKLHYRMSRGELAAWVEKALRDAALWAEVKDKLNERAPRCPAGSSSGWSSPARSPCSPKCC
jgi:hypothetical protein